MENITKFINKIGIFIMISAIVSIAQIVIQDKENEKQSELIKSKNYENWKNCINGSDGTDSDCQKCDSLYNHNGDFSY